MAIAYAGPVGRAARWARPGESAAGFLLRDRARFRAPIGINKTNLIILTGEQMDMEIVKLSTRGQFVIPQEMRSKLKLRAGEKLLVIEDAGSIVVRPISRMSKRLMEELAGARMAAGGWKDVGEGKASRESKEKFLKRLEAW